MSAHEFKEIAQYLNVKPETLAQAIFTWTTEHKIVSESLNFLTAIDDNELIDLAVKGLRHRDDDHYSVLRDNAQDQRVHDPSVTIFSLATAVLAWFVGKQMHRQANLDVWIQDALRRSGDQALPTEFTLRCQKCQKTFTGARGQKLCSNACANAVERDKQAVTSEGW